MEPKFTPGPWFAGAKRVWANETEDRLGMELTLHGGNNRDNNANARLIAAAPDLYAALQKAALVLSGEAMTKSELIKALELAQAALAKAQGKYW